MTKVARIRFTSDEHHCETCGWSSDDYGIEVWLDDKKIIDHPDGAAVLAIVLNVTRYSINWT